MFPMRESTNRTEHVLQQPYCLQANRFSPALGPEMSNMRFIPSNLSVNGTISLPSLCNAFSSRG